MKGLELIKEGDWILINYDDKRYLKRVNIEHNFSYKKGNIQYKDLIGKPYGIKIGEITIFKPTIEDIILYGINRLTQIVYPKDSFYIASKLNILENDVMLEFGTGSGAASLVFSYLLKESGKLISFEKEERLYKNAKKNIEKFKIYDNITLLNQEFNLKNFQKEFKDLKIDKAFVDIREPNPILNELFDVLKPSANVCFLLPTTNQVIDLLKNIRIYFDSIEVKEILVRNYKIVPERFRPEDIMSAHTAYLIFAKRKLEKG